MRPLREHPIGVTLLAFAIAAVAVLAMAAAFGFPAFAHAWTRTDWPWLALGLGGQLLAFPAYVVSYRVVARFDGGPRLPLPALLRIVIAGFGPSAAGGGFALDRRALHALHQSDDGAIMRVLGLGALEWAVLAPAAWISAAVLLVVGEEAAMPSLLWPWVLTVPAGFAVGFWAASPGRRERLAARPGPGWASLAKALTGVGVVASLARGFSTCWQAWLGTVLYWALDIASFYACVRFLGRDVTAAEAVVAYATGYALTRRSMPLGGAGVTEVLMTLALHWVGQPLAAALAIVVLYRVFNFVLPAAPALIVRPRVYPLVEAAAEGRVPSHAERRRAGAG
ncbi:MAG TPA: YbhN family protein [Solirubrobacteraceae bacterium]|nr:YbhN family protein [Solirubrobacteraceae bacterium]